MLKFLFSLFLSVCVSSLFAQGMGEGRMALGARIDTLIKYKLPEGSNVGISVYDLTESKTLYAYQADKLSRPASTMKLLTTITALSLPEADEPFRTEVWYKGNIEQDTLRGDLYIIGGFDPEFSEEALDSLVGAVARLPFSVLQGKVYGDVSAKDSLYWGSGWLWDDTPDAFQPYLSPLMLEKGVVTVVATPGVSGDSARLALHPLSSYYTLTNRTQSRTPAAGRFRVSRDWLTNGNNLIVTGNVSSKQMGTVNIYSSQDFFMHTFAERLQARGIAGTFPYAFGEWRADSTAHRVAVYETPVQDVLKQALKESDNLSAEAMLWRVGRQTTGGRHITAKDGLDAICNLIEKLGYDPDRYRLADGCGLSHYDYVSPDLLVAFLRFAYSRTDVFQKLYKALPIAGVDGTLKYRMPRGTRGYGNVHAKTGTYTGISCLAGYLRAANGHLIAFAIMNQNTLSGREARAFQDAVCGAVIGE